MNTLHLHLILNHVPIFGLFFGVVLLLGALWKKSRLLGSASLLTFIFSGLIAFIVFQTGEGAEEHIEHMAGISKQTIETHEEAGAPGMWLSIITGVVSLAFLLIELTKKNIQVAGRYITLVLAIVSFGFMVRAGLTGGAIRHTEINGTVTPVQGQDNAESAPATEDDDD